MGDWFDFNKDGKLNPFEMQMKVNKMYNDIDFVLDDLSKKSVKRKEQKAINEANHNKAYDNYKDDFGDNLIVTFTCAFFSFILFYVGNVLSDVTKGAYVLFFIAGFIFGCLTVVYFCRAINELIFKKHPNAYIIMSLIAIPLIIMALYLYFSGK